MGALRDLPEDRVLRRQRQRGVARRRSGQQRPREAIGKGRLADALEPVQQPAVRQPARAERAGEHVADGILPHQLALRPRLGPVLPRSSPPQPPAFSAGPSPRPTAPRMQSDTALAERTASRLTGSCCAPRRAGGRQHPFSTRVVQLEAEPPADRDADAPATALSGRVASRLTGSCCARRAGGPPGIAATSARVVQLEAEPLADRDADAVDDRALRAGGVDHAAAVRLGPRDCRNPARTRSW